LLWNHFTQNPACRVETCNALFSSAIMRAVEPASFTIQFPEHLSREKRQYCFDRCSNYGAIIKQQGDHVFRIVCSKRQQLIRVGYLLLCSHISDMCQVISTTGRAEARASAYKHFFDRK
jgi:hypothetical protein